MRGGSMRGEGGHIVGVREWRVKFEADANGRNGSSQRGAVCSWSTAAAASAAAAAAAAAAGSSADDHKDVDKRRPS